MIIVQTNCDDIYEYFKLIKNIFIFLLRNVFSYMPFQVYVLGSISTPFKFKILAQSKSVVIRSPESSCANETAKSLQ